VSDSACVQTTQTVADTSGGGEPAPLLTGCILKLAKILHENALFLHKNFKNLPPPQILPSTLPLSIPNFWIRHWTQIC